LGQKALDAFEVHRQIAAAWDDMPRRGPEMHVRNGFGHPTLSWASWDGTTLTVSQDRPGWRRVWAWHDDLGDRTVPAISAIPLEMDDTDPTDVRIPTTHGRIGSLAQVTGILEGYEGRRPPAKIGVSGVGRSCRRPRTRRGRRRRA
jgi:hypothetical protein